MASKLKKTLLDILEGSIGRYVYNLDADNLNVGLWSGKIELNNMELNTDAINAELSRQAIAAPDLAVPIRVLSGMFSNISIDIPWTRISSKPVVFHARGLSILVEPFDHVTASASLISTGTTMDEEKAKKQRTDDTENANAYRESANALRSLSVLSEDEETDSSAKGSSYTARLTQRIMENIQFDLEDVNISLKDSTCAAGIVLKSLSVFSMDENGLQKYIDRSESEPFLYKSLNLSGFGIYCDPLKNKIKEDHSYLLAPLYLQMNFRQSDSDKCIDFPKFKIDSELQKLTLTASHEQLQLLNNIGKSLKGTSNITPPLFPEYRPDVPINKDTAHLWWKYAFRSIGRLSMKRSWSEFFIAYHKKKRYIPLYSRMAHHESCPWLTSLSDKEIAEIKVIHDDKSISIEGVMGWRNIADAQIDLKKKALEKHDAKKAAKSSYYNYFFASSTDDDNESDEQPLVSLSSDELKELESISMATSYASDLSEDSWICDVKFSLKAFEINLVRDNPITSFSMHTVSCSFNLHANGASQAEFILSSINIADLTTVNTLFPSMLRTLESPDPSSFPNALMFKLDKKKNGDQDIQLKMVSIELVASPRLLIELKNFVDFEQPKGHKGSLHLRASDDGDEDIFYDADIAIDVVVLIADETIEAAKNVMSDTFSDALNNAWESKKANQQNLNFDIDINAPIIIIPENCIDPNANVIVIDLGRFSFLSSQSSPKVLDWFSSNVGTSDTLELEHYKLELSELKLILGKVGKQDWYVEKHLIKVEDTNVSSSQAILEPLSVTINVGSEKVANKTPRMCVFGVLPMFSIHIGPFQIVKLLSISNAWSKYAKKLTAGEKDVGAAEKISSKKTSSLESLKTSSLASRASSDSVVDNVDETIETIKVPKNDILMYLSFSLLKLSVTLVTDSGAGMQAHLVSVVASSTSFSNGSSANHLGMGWFWILNNLPSKYACRQRLIAHSELPQSASSFAQNEDYNIMEELDKLGVFSDGYSGSSDLADIRQYSFSEKNIDQTIFSQKEQGLLNYYDDQINAETSISLVDTKFCSLYLNCNPQAIKNMMTMKDSLVELIYKSSSLYRLINEPKLSKELENVTKGIASTSASITFLRTNLKKVQIYLNSAKDDLPMFMITMVGTKVDVFSFSGSFDDMIANVGVDDLRMVTPKGRANSSYNTVLGLAPSEATSLLSVQYFKGNKAVSRCKLDSVNKDKCDTCTIVDLSPMKFVFLNSQIMALSDYATQGILGALTSAAAAKAAIAAAEVSEPDEMDKVYQINLHGFNITIPKEGSSSQYLALNFNLACQFLSLSNFKGSGIYVSFKELSIESDGELPLVDEPIEMKAKIFLPSTEADPGSITTKIISVDFSRAFFLLSRGHYKLIMSILSENIGGQDNYLRLDPNETCLCELLDEDVLALSDYLNAITSTIEESSSSDHSEKSNEIIVIETPESDEDSTLARTDLSVKFEELGLQLSDQDDLDPILYFAAVKTSIWLRLVPDLKKMSVDMTLSTMLLEDRRLKTMGRDFRSIINHMEQNDGHDSKQDVFRLNFVKYDASSSIDIDLFLGSLQIVVIPDILPDVLYFLSDDAPVKQVSDVEEPRSDTVNDETQRKENIKDLQALSQVSIENETVFGLSVDKQQSAIKVSMKTSICRFVLVDMGSVLLQSSSNSSLTEAIALQAKMNISFEMSSDAINGDVFKRDLDVNCESMETFFAQGSKLLNPIQIIEPTSINITLQMLMQNTNEQVISFKFDVTTSLDLFISMQNIALFNAIVSSITESTKTDNLNKSDETRHIGMDNTEEKSIELAQPAAPQFVSIDTEKVVDSSTETKYIVNYAFVLAQVSVTIINDLQGLDQALVKFKSQNTISRGDIIYTSSVSPDKNESEISFQVIYSSIFLLEYFDQSSCIWENFLVQPWEFSLAVDRKEIDPSQSGRILSSVDLDSQPCCISFSEQFLVSLGAASKMWSTLLDVTKSDPIEEENVGSNSSSAMLKRSLARSIVTAMPYGLKNITGVDVSYSIKLGDKTLSSSQACLSNAVEFFQYESSQSKGVGSERLYGQDVKYNKSVEVHVNNNIVFIKHIDSEINNGRQVHSLGNFIVFSEVCKIGKTTVLVISSQIKLHNSTIIPFNISVQNFKCSRDIGTCYGTWKKGKKIKTSSKRVSASKDKNKPSIASALSSGKSARILSDTPSSIGIPIDMTREFIDNNQKSELSLFVSPLLQGINTNDPFSSQLLFCGSFNLPSIQDLVKMAEKESATTKTYEIVFRLYIKSETMKELAIDVDSIKHVLMVAQISIKVSLVDNVYPFVELFLQPRTVLRNTLPVKLRLTSSMPHTYSIDKDESTVIECNSQKKFHSLDQGDTIEVFTGEPAVDFGIAYAESPLGGPILNRFEFLIPLGEGRTFEGPMSCVIPIENSESKRDDIDFLISKSADIFEKISSNDSVTDNGCSYLSPQDQIRYIYFTTPNFIVDTTKSLSFEPALRSRGSTDATTPTFLSFDKKSHNTLLPDATKPFIVTKNINTDKERKSLPFTIDEVSICEGGIESSPIIWKDKTRSNYYVYRELKDLNKSQVHVIPEFVIFNGCPLDTISVKQKNGVVTKLSPGEVAPIFFEDTKEVFLQFEIPELKAVSNFHRVDVLEMNFCDLHSTSNSSFVGKVVLQTIVGGIDSRLIIKLGSVEKNIIKDAVNMNDEVGTTSDDCLDVQISLAKFEMTLKDSQLKSSVAQLCLDQLSVRYKKEFKYSDDDKSEVEYNNFAFAIHRFRILDCAPDSPYPEILGNPIDSDFIKLNIKLLGPLQTDLVQVELIDLKLVESEDKSASLTINAGEEFVWRLLDVVNRVFAAIEDMTGVLLIIDWDEETEEYVVTIVENSGEDVRKVQIYTPPEISKLFDIKTAQISPINLNVSFIRAPEASRYKNVGGSGGAMMEYFTKRLKFKIDNATIKFDGYVVNDITGPPDIVIGQIQAVYIHRVKGQVLMLISAVSFQDWKTLTSRKGGGDEYVEGDILRMTGNAVGSSADYILNSLTTGIGDGVTTITGVIGGGFRTATKTIGLGAVGEGVDSAMTGVGGGIGSTIKGVGQGAGSLIKGTGQGAGLIIGGIFGGAVVTAKGVGKGIYNLDAGEVAAGFNQGATAAAGGVTEGVGTAARGVGNAAWHVGDGVVSGASQTGRGCMGLCCCFNCKKCSTCVVS